MRYHRRASRSCPQGSARRPAAAGGTAEDSTVTAIRPESGCGAELLLVYVSKPNRGSCRRFRVFSSRASAKTNERPYPPARRGPIQQCSTDTPMACSHVPAKYLANALAGRSATGRWGTEGGFPVLYLGRPTDSVVVEAYRHLIDPITDDPVPPISPRALITCDMSVSMILDLRSAANRAAANLTMCARRDSNSQPSDP